MNFLETAELIKDIIYTLETVKQFEKPLNSIMFMFGFHRLVYETGNVN